MTYGRRAENAAFAGGLAKRCGRDGSYRRALGNRCLPEVEPSVPPAPQLPPNFLVLPLRTLLHAARHPERSDPRLADRLGSTESRLHQDP
jgi:hypothetical protein